MLQVQFPEIILPSSKYDVVTILKIFESYSSKQGLNLYDNYLKLNEYAIEADLNSIYKMFLNLSSIKFVIDLLPTMGKTYNNWMLIQVTSNTANSFTTKTSFPDVCQIENATLPSLHGGYSGVLKACKYKINKIVSGKSYSNTDLTGWKTVETEIHYSKI